MKNEALENKVSLVTSFVTEELAGKARYFEVNELMPERFFYKLVQEYGIFELLLSDDIEHLKMFIELMRIISVEFASLASVLTAQGIYAIMLMKRFGTKEQQDRWLSQLISGKTMGAFAFSEEGINFLNNLPQTTARQTEEGWVLTGDKFMVSNITEAEFVMVLAQTVDIYGEKGTGIFIVECHQEGVLIGEMIDKEGLRAMPLAPISFHQVHIPNSQLLGLTLQGYEQWSEIMLLMRLAISAQSLGIAQGIFEKGLKDSQVQRNFGKRLIDVPLNQAKFAELFAQLSSCQSFYDQYLKTDLTQSSQVALLKLMTANVAEEVADEVVRMTGIYSFASEYDLERYQRDAHVISYYGGSKENLQKMIAQQWL